MSFERGCRRSAAAFLALVLTAWSPAALAEAETIDPAAAPAAESAPAPATRQAQAAGAQPELVLFDKLMVVGGPEEASRVPGSAHSIGHEELERQDYADIHRVLLHVPGVYVQEEEGFGLRPNISIRGTGGERSSKITLLEDGVLVAPAPYAAPSAYYFPTVGRMHTVEVRKGSSSVRQGPYTNGGVLNLVSTPIPGSFGGQLEVYAGEHGTARLHANAGGTAGRHGQWGWLLETYQQQTDGFKDLDGGGETGFELGDYLGKLRWTSAPDSRVFHAVDLKLGRTDQGGDETYLGLTEADFEATPLRRYAGSREDRIDTEHEQVQLRWLVAPRQDFEVVTTAYRNDFFRNWYKLGSVAGQGLGTVLAQPGLYADELAILRGERDSDPGDLAVRANRRDYYAQGVESVATWRLGRVGGASHELDFGVRLHEDEEDRFQEDDLYQMVDGRMVLTSSGAPGSNANRVSSAEAVAVFVQDRIGLGRLTLTPGLRFESIDFLRRDWSRTDPGREGNAAERVNGVDVWIPGLGLTWRLDDGASLFAGIHRGFAPPGPGRDADTEAEDSVNYELGVRAAGRRVGYQVAGFFNDYSNLLGRDTLSSGGTGSGDLFNGGEVDVWGLEASADSDLGRLLGRDLAVRVPLRLAYTYTQAEFRNTFESDFGPWGATVEAGDELPYLPAHQLSLGTGLEVGRYAAYVDLSWLDETRTQAGSGPIASGEGTDSRLLLDLSTRARLVSGLDLVGQVRNLTDEVYVASRHPAGARPGMPRTLMVGLSWGF